MNNLYDAWNAMVRHVQDLIDSGESTRDPGLYYTIRFHAGTLARMKPIEHGWRDTDVAYDAIVKHIVRGDVTPLIIP